jgi:SsrA-binding protein
MAQAQAPGVKLIAVNKKARHFYLILETLEAGLALTGSEVKSLRGSKVNFKDGYVRFANGEAFLSGVHISPYENAGYAQHDPDRDRKLLLHEHEIANWKAKVEQKGLTVVPLKFYFKAGRVKLEIGLARGKNVHDRRDALKERDLDREAQRERDRY